MIANQIDVLDNDSGFAEAVTTYLKAVDAGQSPDPQEWLQRYPELAEELADFFAGQGQLDRLSAPLRALAPTPELPADMRSPRAIVDGGAFTHADSANSWPSSENRIFGDYQLLEVIARGGMGIVYKARHGRLNRIVALKLILSGQFAKRSDVERFQTEAEAAASLDYPHIVPIYEVGEEKGQHYFSMKLIEGQNLAQRLSADSAREGKTLAEPRTPFRSTSNSETRRLVKILATVAGAVHYAHQHGILHRDLKPGNILLDSAEQPYVTDFGLAKLVAGDQTATQSGAIVGTASYMAPEQAAGSKGLTTAVDIYSLGAILYEVLTGRPPFREETALETLLRVRERDPARPSDVHPKVDRDLETICLKCLERDPLRRYGSAEALAEELDRWLAGEPIHARPVSRIERTWRHCRRNPVVSSLLAAVVLVAAGGFVGVLSQWQIAVANGQEAITNAAAAQVSAQEAKDQAQVAAVQRDEAEKRRDEVKALNEKLQATQAELRSTLYAAHINLAQHAWDASNP